MNTRTTKKAPFGVLFVHEVCLAAREVTLRVVKLLPLAKPNFTKYCIFVQFVKQFVRQIPICLTELTHYFY